MWRTGVQNVVDRTRSVTAVVQDRQGHIESNVAKPATETATPSVASVM
jgi:hypothetical protein